MSFGNSVPDGWAILRIQGGQGAIEGVFCPDCIVIIKTTLKGERGVPVEIDDEGTIVEKEVKE